MALNNGSNVKKTWDKPTVYEVFSLIEEAATRYKLNDWQDLADIVGVSNRTLRRWKKGVETQPLGISPITFVGYAVLYSAAKGESYIEPLKGCNWQSLPETYFYKATNYQCPSKSVLTQLIGKNSLTGQTREQIGQSIGIAPKKLADQINNESVSFITWSLLLLYIGVPVDKVLRK